MVGAPEEQCYPPNDQAEKEGEKEEMETTHFPSKTSPGTQGPPTGLFLLKVLLTPESAMLENEHLLCVHSRDIPGLDCSQKMKWKPLFMILT